MLTSMRFCKSLAISVLRGFFITLLWHATIALAASDGMLWKIQAADGPISYLFGTIHVDDARVATLTEPISTALETVQVFMMEVLPSNDVSPYYMKEGSLAQWLTSAELEQVYAAADFHGLPREMAVRMKPWLLAMVFDLPVSQSPYTLDAKLYLQAQKSGKRLQALESQQEHFATLENLAMDEQLLLLRSVLKRSQEQKKQDFELMISAYLSGDPEQVAAIDQTLSAEDIPAELWDRLRIDLLDKRNVRMAERIASAARQQSIFVAVGAAHLPGNDGLLARLRQMGFVVMPAGTEARAGYNLPIPVPE
ncbi:hypothetical protein SAMN05192560_0870 [Methylobacillus rhizosphaerae]|uniref:TraB family protein n=2 Tax=Methylobacillus rhizosphaerae TaxID=551994 RepID=A0A238YUX2_9PROT|nr:hypothetical protein SAMN05192560_0870 [Methylobacillus rhizosphaerae]